MTRIAGTDHVLLLLRDKLRKAGGQRAGRATAVRADPRPIERLRAMAGFDALDEDERRRAVIHGLLADELGDAVANDAAFGAVLDDVLRIITEMPGGSAMIDHAAAILRDG